MIGIITSLHSVSKASRKNSNPTVSNWNKVVNILKYLNQTKNYYISYKNKGKLIGYTDSDFTRDLSNSKSTSGKFFFLASVKMFLMEQITITKKQKKQQKQHYQ